MDEKILDEKNNIEVRDTEVTYPSVTADLNENKKISFEDLFKLHLNDFGKFQWIMMILMAIPCFAPSFHLMSWIFIGSNDTPFRCKNDNTNWTVGYCNCTNGYQFLTDDVSKNAITQASIK